MNAKELEKNIKEIIERRDYNALTSLINYVGKQYYVIGIIVKTRNLEAIEVLIKSLPRAEQSDVVEEIVELGDTKFIKDCIAQNKKYLNLSTARISRLIVETKDLNYIKECIDNREDFGFSSKHIRNLILGTEDSKYMMKCVEDRGILGLSSEDITKLITETKDCKYMKKCVEDRDILGLSSEDITKIIVKTKDPDYIMKCVEDREYFGLSSENITSLIASTEKSQYIMKCVEDRENLKLTSEDVTTLIFELTDPKDIMKCVYDRENLGLSSEDVKVLISEIIAPEYIMKCVYDRENLGLSSEDVKKLIFKITDSEYIMKCVDDKENLGLSLENTKSLIFKIKDPQYIIKCIENRQNLGLSAEEIANLIIKTGDPQYIMSCVNDKEKLGLQSTETVDLIIATGNPRYIVSCVNDREKLGLQSTETANLILATGDLGLIEKAQELNIDSTDRERLRVINKSTNIDLPPEMTIGIEIESEGEGQKDKSELITKLLSQTNPKWKNKPDGSLKYGTEVVSPVLTGNHSQSSNEIRSVCAILNGVSQTTSERCGGHIHIGADYLKSKQDWINLIEIWANSEMVLYTISNEKGTIPRNGVPDYAVPISKKIETALKKGTIDLEGEEDLNEFVAQTVSIQKNRYSGINFLNIRDGGINTIEFRLANGTINPNTWIENVNLFGGIVRVAHELTSVLEKPEEQRTEAERKMLENFEILQTEQDEELILKALLELTVSQEQRQIYMDRYNANKPLLEESPEIQEAITKQLSTNKIGRKAIEGDKATDGVNYEQGSAIIESDLQRSEIIHENGTREE